MTPNAAYEWLKKEQTQTGYLNALGNLSSWDQRTYLPPKGQDARAEQLATLALLVHERNIRPKIGECLDAIEGSALVRDKASEQAVNAREWRREYDRLIRIPSALAENLARATAAGETAWETAREENDWGRFAPYLERIVALTKEKADALGFENEPYDALIEDFEPAETTDSLARLFTQMKGPLIALVDRIAASPVSVDETILSRSFQKETQARFSQFIAEKLGYDFDAGRLDESAHPFTMGVAPGDVRITTRFNEHALAPALLGTIHEAGHGMYEQGLPAAHFGTPRGQAVSLGIHESQSRLYENFVGRSRAFWQWALPLAKKYFPVLEDAALDPFLLALNRVRPSLIRVEADEVTYNLHIILRFELEVALMRGDLAVMDLPAAWNEKMKGMFNLTPPTDADGVMQDVHWSAGLIGYFPTYALGNIYAAQLFDAVERAHPHLESRFEKGDFDALEAWLRREVHEPGATYPPKTLIARATGAAPDPKFLIDYLNRKFTALYQL